MSDFRLKVFRSVAKNLSFTKASQELFVSQPAITKHIQELEAAYQTRLFDRQGSRISLTESGNLLLEHCERILEDYKRLEYEMHLLHNEYTGGLKLGASTTIAQYVLPPLLASFIGKFPQVSLSLLNGNSREIEAALQEHRIDLGFVEGVFRLPNIRYTTFLEDELPDELPEFKDFRRAYINPHILEVGGEEVSMEEGCLSLPGIHETVKRPDRIHVTYLDEELKEHDEWVEGYLARVMQHEFDHLDGKMFIDHLSALRKQMIKGKLGAMLKGKARCSYKVKTIK